MMHNDFPKTSLSSCILLLWAQPMQSRIFAFVFIFVAMIIVFIDAAFQKLLRVDVLAKDIQQQYNRVTLFAEVTLQS